jgi:hypothetical protein
MLLAGSGAGPSHAVMLAKEQFKFNCAHFVAFKVSWRDCGPS